MAVYVVMDNVKYNLESAKKFGEIRIICDERSGPVEPYVSVIRRALRDFNDDDYLILAGDYIAIGIAFSVAAEMTCGHVKVLKWTRGAYFPVEVNLNERDHEGSPDRWPRRDRSGERGHRRYLK
jgi:molybdopterin-guanine dinucleotide biosynthesis protein A